ncbi:MAG: 6-bladed beta-propeller, partial [Gammaproteobacteria bacterium]|nr:6-bladed beta-propeller [Gammaproteobacteria bacterium]NIW99402.1 6-bladed beta-propeller [Phycisphaerae bacterium]
MSIRGKSGALYWKSAVSLFIALTILPSLASSEEIYKFERIWPTLQQPWYFHETFGVGISRQGFVYLADQYGNCIHKFTLDGQFVTSWGSTGSGDGEFSFPQGVAVDADGYVYVADRNNYRIQKFSSDGQ